MINKITFPQNSTKSNPSFGMMSVHNKLSKAIGCADKEEEIKLLNELIASFRKKEVELKDSKKDGYTFDEYIFKREEPHNDEIIFKLAKKPYKEFAELEVENKDEKIYLQQSSTETSFSYVSLIKTVKKFLGIENEDNKLPSEAKILNFPTKNSKGKI